MSRTPKHAVILCHPKRDSFNGAVADAYCAAVRDIGHEVCLRDLYRIGFDPVLKDIERPGDPGFQSLPDVAEEVRLISGASVFVLIYPIWFGTPPAMRSEEHTSELQSLMRISYAVFCLTKKTHILAIYMPIISP